MICKKLFLCYNSNIIGEVYSGEIRRMYWGITYVFIILIGMDYF